MLVPPGAIRSGLNAFVTVGTALTTRSSVAALALSPRSVCRSPAAMVLVWVPVVLEVTVAVMVQLPLAGMVPPLA